MGIETEMMKMTKSKINDGGYAFPCGPDHKSGWDAEYGMSLRQYYAGQALVGLGIWMPDPAAGHPSLTREETLKSRAETAVKQADYLIESLKAGA